MSPPPFADVLLPFGDTYLDQTFTYLIPPPLLGKLSLGDPVLVPFRKATASGYVVGFLEHFDRPSRAILAINTKTSPISSEVLAFSTWLVSRYVSPPWDALRSFIFPANGHERKQNLILPQKQANSLTKEQEEASTEIKRALLVEKSQTFLLHGITSSGKTEVYLDCTKAAVKQGKEVLILVPEIPLSFHLAKRFQEVFGDQVAILHSALTDKERREQQARIQHEEVSIVIGPRMSLFAPFHNLGLIIMDEEHDPSYKQESHPRYHSFVVAEKLAERQKAVLLLGSATPSLESYYRGREGNIKLLELKTRFESRSLPHVTIVDMKEEKGKTPRPFSFTLLEAIQETIKKGQQVILFINRRGFSPLVLCSDCGYTFHCPDCSISLTLHLSKNILWCHYCDFRKTPPEVCPDCQSQHLTYRGFGTQRLEETLTKNVPEARVLRLDRDVASKRGGSKAVLEAFSKGEANILIGTQMVTKGFHFPNVSLVGIIHADHLLHFPDFRSGERTFQLLTQVSGRAGRGEVEGRVILQTYDPEHPAIQAAASQDYKAFYEVEIEARRKALYPPFVSLTNLVLTGQEEEAVEKQAGALREFIEKCRSTSEDLVVLGPSPCPIEKISKNFRWHLLLKAKTVEELMRLGKETQTWYAKEGNRKVRLTIDIDPVRLL